MNCQGAAASIEPRYPQATKAMPSIIGARPPMRFTIGPANKTATPVAAISVETGSARRRSRFVVPTSTSLAIASGMKETAASIENIMKKVSGRRSADFGVPGVGRQMADERVKKRKISTMKMSETPTIVTTSNTVERIFSIQGASASETLRVSAEASSFGCGPMSFALASFS